MRMYRQYVIVIRNGEVEREREFLRTTEKTVSILENMARIIKNPTEKDKIVEYHSFGVLECKSVREMIDFNGDTIKTIMTFKKFCD